MGVRLYLQLDSNQYHLDREVRSQTLSDSSKAVACLRLCKYLVDRRLHHVIAKITFTDKVFEGVTPSILVLTLTPICTHNPFSATFITLRNLRLRGQIAFCKIKRKD